MKENSDERKNISNYITMHGTENVKLGIVTRRWLNSRVTVVRIPPAVDTFCLTEIL
jgi:hypothetical protein